METKTRPARRGISVIIATLLMVAAAVMLTSIVFFWGLSYQGQNQQIFGSAIFRSNNAAQEGVSMDSVLFVPVTTSPTVTYSATVYARNFGDQPVRIAGVHLQNLQSGAVPQGFDCEVSMPGHLTVESRSAASIDLHANCSPSLVLPVCYDGGTVSITLSTEGGTSFTKNYQVPPASVSVLSEHDTPSATAPSVTLAIGNVGCGSETISTVALTGASSNGAGHFIGSVTAAVPSSGQVGVTASDGSTWTANPSSASLYQSMGSGTSLSVKLSTVAAGSATKLVAGDHFTVTVTTLAGSTYSAVFTA